MSARRTVSVVGPFPPPVHGAADVTRRIAAALKEFVEVEALAISPVAGRRGLAYHASRIARVVAAAGALARGRGPVYVSAAGGFGLGYNVLLLAVARLVCRPIFVHHHSFAYLDVKDWLAALLVRVAGPAAVHVCLCPRMADRLAATYGPVTTCIVSNAAFFPPTVSSWPTGSKPTLRIGHFGNLSAEKGLDLVVALAEALDRRGLPVELVLAGPSLDRSSDAMLASARRRLGPRLIELGPLYDADKERFFSSADVFVFPTRYANEAEPLVVFEALAHGLPVIAFGRGCIAEQIGDVGLVVKPDGDFVALAASVLDAWWKSPADFAAIRSRALERSAALNREARRQLDRFLARVRAAAS